MSTVSGQMRVAAIIHPMCPIEEYANKGAIRV